MPVEPGETDSSVGSNTDRTGQTNDPRVADMIDKAKNGQLPGETRPGHDPSKDKS